TLHRGVNQYLTRMLGQQLYDGALDRAATPQELASGSHVGLTAEYLTEPAAPEWVMTAWNLPPPRLHGPLMQYSNTSGTTRNVHLPLQQPTRRTPVVAPNPLYI